MSKKYIGRLESFLIQAASAQNPDLQNWKGVDRPKWLIRGVTGRKPGKQQSQRGSSGPQWASSERAALMKRILIPTDSFEDWRGLVARPDLHWKAGYSAMTVARSWEAAAGFPPEVRAALDASSEPALSNLTPLLIVPEYKIPLPGGSRASQVDVFALARGKDALVAIAVEGKVEEPFGPTVGQRRADQSEGLEERYAFLLHCLGLDQVPDPIRYQLLHRAASAVLAAEEFFAPYAVMLVHSFSPSGKWFEDFAQFAALFGKKPRLGEVVPATRCGKTELFLGWCKGDQQFRVAQESAP